MTRSDEFESSVGATIADYVAVKRALGRRWSSAEYILRRLDRFLVSRHAADLKRETFAAWCESIESLAAGSRRQWMRTVYHLCLFRRRQDPGCFVPDPNHFPPSHPRRVPHIFADAEVARLLCAADCLERDHVSPLHRQVARLGVVLLYTVGLRRGEVVRLTLADYDSPARTLLIRDTKFYKSRLVPVSADAVVELDRYLAARQQPGFPCQVEARLLLNHHGGRFRGYTGEGFGQLMRRLIRSAGIRTTRGRVPRVHDLRFTFAAHALLRWYRAGVDVQARLPALAAYMGHVSVVSTQYYLPLLEAVAEVASERYRVHCSAFLPFAGFAGGPR
ncbi:MAG: tyrosine-type recombinase/integrase [Planctomycetes bacterium]|nr:tyrosine-type recombinase/integrase [Planctomycetota bacterium]